MRRNDWIVLISLVILAISIIIIVMKPSDIPNARNWSLRQRYEYLKKILPKNYEFYWQFDHFGEETDEQSELKPYIRAILRPQELFRLQRVQANKFPWQSEIISIMRCWKSQLETAK